MSQVLEKSKKLDKKKKLNKCLEIKNKFYNYDSFFKINLIKFSFVPLFFFYCYLKKNELTKNSYINFYLIFFNKSNFSTFKFLENIFFLNINVLIFSNALFKKKTDSFNWSFIKNNNYFFSWKYVLNNKFNELSNFWEKYFFKKAKLTLFFIIDTYYNKKLVFYLKKFKQFTIGAPMNKSMWSVLTYPLIPSEFLFAYHIFFLIEILYFYIIIFFKKKNYIKKLS